MGVGGAEDLVARAEHALAMVGRDPHAALLEADDIVAALPRARTPEQGHALAVAHRAAGLALRDVGDADAGESRLRRAVSVADRHGTRDDAAQARMSLAYVQIERGRMRAALATIDHASALATGAARAQVRVMRALVLQRWGRSREAVAEYRDALHELARHPDPAWEGRLRNNRALLLAYEGDSEGAIGDLRRARDLYLEAGRSLDATLSLWNLGWVLGMKGEIPAALALFDQADAELESEGLDQVEAPERWSDRAEVLLRAGLVDEAAASARRAVEVLHRLGWSAGEAEAQLLTALCLLAGGVQDLGRDEAEAARAAFARQDRPAWAALAEYVVMKSAFSTSARPADLERAGRVASMLRDLGWEAPSADLRVTAGQAALRAHDTARARMLLGPLASRQRASRLDVRSRVWFARALLHESDGEDRAADTALHRAWSHVEDQRLLVGATELRAGTATHAVDVVAAGSRLALRSGSASACFDWGELGRAAVLRYRPATPPDHAELARALTRLRWTVRAEEDARLGGARDPGLASQRAAQEAEVLRLTRSQPGNGRGARPARSAEVAARLGPEAFVQYQAVDGAVVAVVLTARGRSLTPLGDVAAVTRCIDRLVFGLRRVLTGFGSALGPAALSESIGAACQALDALLLAPLAARVGDAALVISPSGPLAQVPWSLLPSCRGRTVHVTPSATLWCAARDRRDHPRTEVRRGVLAVAGPGLPGADTEVAEVAALHPGSVRMTGGDARVDRVLGSINDASLVHLAAHGHLRRDNPLFSSLSLADGPLTAYELERLPSAPEDVVLPACGSGAPQTVVADETLGLAWTLMGAGTCGVVAPLLAVPDATTRGLMVRLHALLADGVPLADALARAQEAADADDPEAYAVAGCFVAFGA